MKSQKKFKAIFIDDEPLVLEGLKALIDWEANGFDVVGTFDIVEEALEFMEHTQADFVITDINMPVINGLELIRRLKQSQVGLPVCILSGYRDFNYAREALLLEVTSYLVKPVFDDDLLPVVEEVYNQLYARWLEAETMTIGISEIVLGLLTKQYNRKDEIVMESVKNHYSDDVIYSQWRCLIIGSHSSEVCELHQVIKNQDIKDRLSEGILDHFVFINNIDGASVMVINMIVLEELYQRLIQSIHNESDSNYWLTKGIDVNRIEDVYESYESCVLGQFFTHPFESQCGDSDSILTEDLYSKLTDGMKRIDPVSIGETIEGIICGYASRLIEAQEIKADFLIHRTKYYAEIALFLKDFHREQVVQKPIEESQLSGLNSIIHYMKEDMDLLLKAVAEVKNDSNDDLVGNVERYIKEHYTQSISLKSIAEEFFMHPNYLGQKLKKHWGMSYNEYLNRQRVNQSFSLLIETDDSVYHIAEVVGYRNYTAFLKYFKKYTGMTPIEYRKSKKIT